MYEWFDCPWYHRVFPGQQRTTLAFLYLKTVVQNASLEAELLGLTSFTRLVYGDNIREVEISYV